MISHRLYTVFFLEIDTLEIKLNLEDEGARQYKEVQIYFEIFTFNPHLSKKSNPLIYPYTYQSFFKLLRSIRDTYSSTEQAYIRVHMEEKNDVCTAHIYHVKNHKTLSTMRFPKQDWANVEELLLTHDLRLEAIHQSKKIKFQIPRIKATYEIITRPEIYPYMKISCPLKSLLPEAAACAGLSMDDAIETTEKEILRVYAEEKGYKVFE